MRRMRRIRRMRRMDNLKMKICHLNISKEKNCNIILKRNNLDKKIFPSGSANCRKFVE